MALVLVLMLGKHFAIARCALEICICSNRVIETSHPTDKSYAALSNIMQHVTLIMQFPVNGFSPREGLQVSIELHCCVSVIRINLNQAISRSDRTYESRFTLSNITHSIVYFF
jgi:hypothetical protein